MMKQISIYLLFLFGILLQNSAQITVAENNNVGIGVTNPASKLSIGHTGYSHITLMVENTSTASCARPAYFLNSVSGGYTYSYAVTGHNLTTSGYKNVGAQFSAYDANYQSARRTFGLRAIAGNGLGGYNWAVFGYLYGDHYGAAIYGCTVSLRPGTSSKG